MYKTFLATAAAVIALQGCAPQQSPNQAAAEQFNEGMAKTCEASPPKAAAGAAASATIIMTNDGWCAIRTTEADGQPYQLGLVLTRPAHGHVLIRKVSDRTRVEYTPDERFVGTDSFAVALRSRTANTPDTPVQVAVTVTQGEGVAPAPTPAAAPAAAPQRTSPARRATH